MPDSNLQGLAAALGDPATVLGTAIRVTVVYGALLVGLQLSGRRVLGQMTSFDLLTLLLLSNVVQNAMIGPDLSVTGGLLGAAVLLGANRFIARIAPIRRRFERGPILLVHAGQVLAGRLAQEGVSEEELLTAIREHGVGAVEGVEAAVLEMDGVISVIPKAAGAAVRIRHVRSTRNR